MHPFSHSEDTPETEDSDSAPPVQIALNRDQGRSSLPSVTRILQATLSPEQLFFLERWKRKMVAELGEDGFKDYTKNLFRQGKLFHSALEDVLMSGTTREDDQHAPDVLGYMKSVAYILDDVSSARAIESSVRHDTLNYLGIVDCVARYSSCDRPCFLRSRKKYILCWAFLRMELMFVPHFRSFEIVIPKNLKVLTVDTRQLDRVKGSCGEGCLLKSTIILEQGYQTHFTLWAIYGLGRCQVGRTIKMIPYSAINNQNIMSLLCFGVKKHKNIRKMLKFNEHSFYKTFHETPQILFDKCSIYFYHSQICIATDPTDCTKAQNFIKSLVLKNIVMYFKIK
ncbi:mitochondrial genome maintenance exonuclease 1 isoform X2 [Syngnathoides biaculeatus]|nr:mitochondrial genome maintenance exonuclease 1 isoform X2 [Syngnathoides biaculeatus]